MWVAGSAGPLLTPIMSRPLTGQSPEKWLNTLNLCTTVSNWLIGYHMHTHIAKSLNTRCKAIQNAVKSYNAAALHMSPPHPTLDWEKASHYAFLEDFQLLYNTQQYICHKQWSNPVVQVAMKQKQWIDRAREEIENCNVEILHLHTRLLSLFKRSRRSLLPRVIWSLALSMTLSLTDHESINIYLPVSQISTGVRAGAVKTSSVYKKSEVKDTMIYQIYQSRDKTVIFCRPDLTQVLGVNSLY